MEDSVAVIKVKHTHSVTLTQGIEMKQSALHYLTARELKKNTKCMSSLRLGKEK